MSRVLELLDTQADFQTRRCARNLARDLGEGFDVEVRTIGRGGDYPGTWRAVRGLRSGRWDVVHAWGAGPLLAAALGGDHRIIFTPGGDTALPIRLLRAAMAHRRIDAICPTSTMCRRLITRGVEARQCHLIRPGVEFSRVRSRRDPALRTALGLAEDEYVMMAIGETTRAASHEDALWAAAIVHGLDPCYKLLLWGAGRAAQSLRRFTERMAPPGMVRDAAMVLGRAVEPEELLPAADMLLVSAAGDVATLPIAIAMASALPIVGTAAYCVAELLEDRHTALMIPPHSPRELAQRIVELREDRSLQWRLSDTARTEAFEYFAHTRFVDQHRAAYRQCAQGQRIEIAEPPPGAGQRLRGLGTANTARS